MLQVAVFVCIGWLLSVCLHEFGHAIVAYWGGDTSVKDKGYLTLNPLKYTDINLSLVLPLIFLLLGGIPLPGAAVYIDERRLRNRWWKSAVSAAGPIASILVTLLLTITFWLGLTSPLAESNWIFPALAFLIYLEIYVVILNLLPIPPLDGYGIIEPWLPAEIQNRVGKFAQYGIIVLFMLLWFVEPLNNLLSDAAFSIGKMLGVPSQMVSFGYILFKKWATILLVTAIGVAFVVRQFTRKQYEVWYERGNASLKAKQYEKAIAAYDRSIRLKPDFYEAWYMRANTLLQLERYDEALSAYDKAIEIQPNDATIWTYRSVALGYLKRYEDAIASCNKAIEINPDYFLAWYNKAGCYAEQGNVDLAIENLQQAVKLDKDKFRHYAKTDSSFDSIREHQLFKQLLGE